jgi:hypothetical protein
VYEVYPRLPKWLIQTRAKASWELCILRAAAIGNPGPKLAKFWDAGGHPGISILQVGRIIRPPESSPVRGGILRALVSAHTSPALAPY